jgi:hypothetical protein
MTPQINSQATPLLFTTNLGNVNPSGALPMDDNNQIPIDDNEDAPID